MPMIEVATNLSNEKVPGDFEDLLTDVLASSMSKPRERIAVEVRAGCRLIHGGSKDPVVVISVKSIGAVSPDDNVRHVAAITSLCSTKLGLEPNKVIVSFYDLAPTHVGHFGTTIAAGLTGAKQ